jgi:hypothetical protein
LASAAVRSADPRVVQQILDQPRLRLDAPVDSRHRALQGDLVDTTCSQDMHPSHQGGQWTAQLVRERRHELVLDPVGLLGPLPRLLLQVEQRLASPFRAAGLGPVLEGQKDALLAGLAV